MYNLVAAKNYNGGRAYERHGKIIILCLRKVSRKARFLVTDDPHVVSIFRISIFKRNRSPFIYLRKRICVECSKSRPPSLNRKH